ncbi:mRNA cleavage and polyadenylation factor subunit [Aspergillus nanangensis]|uniref:Protein CFT1 n=1 Tax=Aspergillus nanangensis TaxID=2582783 RepID=A0AAD4CWV1_ASPNN|nr:mRNA cleavage and polyadenylation factor subunit [Aspergillus nanangensis]
MQCYTELLPPSGVTHALAVPFTSATARNLIVARTSLLQIFSLIDVGSRSQDAEDHERTKLFLEKEYSLPGTITDLCRVKLSSTKSGGEAILLAFRNAKLSLIEWDPERYGISTISIHYYERDDLACSPWVPDLSSCGSILSVDPSSRCAVFNFGVRNLAILPFHQPGDDLVMDDYDSDLDERKPVALDKVNGGGSESAKENGASQTPLLHERKDAIFYTVFTLDLEQRASTTLLSVSRLPSDLFKVVALPPPVGGSLLIGSNELVHVDQAGKTNAVGVNEFSRQVSTFSMTDQSDLALRLEGCVVERLAENNCDLLLILSTGSSVLVKFKLDGRSVSGISVHPVPPHAGGDLMKARASSSAFLGNGTVFLGSEDADSLLLGWSPSNTKKMRSQAKHVVDDAGDFSDDVMSEDDGYEDDLYATSPKTTEEGRRTSGDLSSFGFYNFRINDVLLNIASLRDITLGKSSTGVENHETTTAELELVASHGSGRSGGMVVMKRDIDPEVLSTFEVDSANGVWTVSATHNTAVAQNAQNRYVIVSRMESFDKEQTDIFQVHGLEMKSFKAPEFNPNGDITIDIGLLSNESRVVQVLKNEVRSYDADLGLAQIYPVWDEDTSDERVAVSVSFADPYLAILRDDSTLLLLQADESGDIDEVDLTEGMKTEKCELPKRSNTREVLTEAIVADIGDSWSATPYLILRTGSEDLAMYRPFILRITPEKEMPSLSFFKENNHVLPDMSPSELKTGSPNRPNRNASMRILPDIAGFSSVFLPGASGGFILKTSTSSPHLLRVRGDPILCLDRFHTPENGTGYISLGSKDTFRICQLPHETHFDYSWTMKRVAIGEQIDHLAYSYSSGTYVLGTCHKTEFKLPDSDELHPEWRNEAIAFPPEVDRSSLKVVSPKTWTVIDSYMLDPAEHVMAMKNISLEVSENTHERREMIVVGTSFSRGEDVAARGCVYVFEVIKVVPDPEKPDTDHKLKLIGKEPVKGAVTALSGIGGQGFLIVAQGQKCIVRGLKEDGSLLPVAFMDVQCYVSVVKELKGTGMCILGDAMKGLWFAGYSEEPYKMSLFAKDLDYLKVLTADFLPDGRRLFILVADGDYPKSSNGDRLLSRSKFHTGNFASTLTLLPRTMVSSERAMTNSDESMDLDVDIARHHALVTSQNGSVGLVTCVSEEAYRRLSALQSQLTNILEHPCGLNPRAFRAVESDGSAGRGILDGNLLFQWLDMGKQRKAEIAGRVGANELEIKADLESIGGDGFGYL